MYFLRKLVLAVVKITLAILAGWLASAALMFCYGKLRPGSPEYGPDFEGYVTLWGARVLSIVIALRLSFPSRIVSRTREADAHLQNTARRSLGFDTVFFGLCAVVLLGATIGSPLLARVFRHRASSQWQLAQSENLAELSSLVVDWRSKPNVPELDVRLASLMGQTQTPPNFWVRETAGWSEQELTRLAQFGADNAGSSAGLVELYVNIIRDLERSDDLRKECFFACLAFPSNLQSPPDQAWQAVASIPDAARFVPAAVKRRHETRIAGDVGQWWLLRRDAIETFEQIQPPHDDLATVLAEVLTQAEASLPTFGEETQLLIRRVRVMLERWQQEVDGARQP